MNVIEYSQGQSLLFPSNLRDCLPDDHLSMVINDIVETLDLRPLYVKVSPEGNPSYHPKMMLKILLYSYSTGIFSSRKIQKAIQESIPMIYLAARQVPDFRTISDFRKNNLSELNFLFSQVVEIARRLGMISLGHISIDGTKIRANAADRRTYSEKRLQKEIQDILQRAEQADAQEDATLGISGTEEDVPPEIHDQRHRLMKLQKIKGDLQNKGKEKINATDPDAAFMKTQYGIKTSYNAQLAVEESNQFIVAADVCSRPEDVEQLIPMVDEVQTSVGPIEKLSADSGYSSGENLKAINDRKIDAYIPDPEYQGSQRKRAEEEFFHRSKFTRDEEQDCFVCPAGKKLLFLYYQKRGNKAPLRIYRCREASQCPLQPQCTKSSSGRSIALYPYDKELKAMRAKLDDEAGKHIYKKRQTIVEPAIGHIKEALGFSRFHLRGLIKVKGEFLLICIAHNLKKIAKLWKPSYISEKMLSLAA